MIDPLGGSYYVEWLTEKLEQEAYQYFEKIDSAGGLLKAIKSGYLQREIAENSYRLSKRVETGEDAVVGVNKYSIQEETPINTLKIDFRAQRRQVNRLTKLREERDGAKVKAHLEKLRRAYSDPEANANYPMMDAVMAYATLGEIMQVGREIFGTWKEPMIV